MAAQVVNIWSPQGQETIRAIKNSYKVAMVENESILPEYSAFTIERPESDVQYYDAISRGNLMLTPNISISYAEQPMRQSTMYNVMRQRISNMTSSGLPFAQGTFDRLQYLSGSGIQNLVVHSNPDVTVSQDAPQNAENDEFNEGWAQGLQYRNRNVSPGSYRRPTDLIQASEPLMTEGYFDGSMIRQANIVQWKRGLFDAVPQVDVRSQSFLNQLAWQPTSYGRNYSTYATIG